MSPLRVSQTPENVRADDLAGLLICRPFGCRRPSWGCLREEWIRSPGVARARTAAPLDCRPVRPETGCRWNHPLSLAIAMTGSGGHYVPAFKPRTADKGCFGRPFHDGRVHDRALYRRASFRRLTIGFGRDRSQADFWPAETHRNPSGDKPQHGLAGVSGIIRQVIGKLDADPPLFCHDPHFRRRSLCRKTIPVHR